MSTSPSPRPRIGVLALQGDVREHRAALERLGADTIAVRRPDDLAAIEGLVIPGGESTVMDKLARQFGIRKPLREAIAGGLPVYGTCAGLIMLADRLLDGLPDQQTLGGLDVAVRRNAFGAQVDSFETELRIPELGDEPLHAVFIRAPIVEDPGPAVRVLASVDDRIVAVRQGTLLGTSFHPELTHDDRFHAYFLRMVAESRT